MAGKVELSFGAKDVGLSNTVTKVNSSMKGMDKNTKDVSKSVGMSFGAMVKAGAALAVGFGAIKIAGDALKSLMGNFSEAIKLGSDFDQMSTRTGVAVDSLVVLSRAFENAGVSGGNVGKTINRMQKSIVDAGNGLAAPQRAFENLGISLEDIKELSPEEQFKVIGEGIKNLKTPAERTAVAMDIFGRAGAEALTVFRDGAAGIDVAIDQLGSMPGILAESARAFDTIGDNIAAFKNKGVEFAVGFINQVAPAIELVTHLLSRIDAAAIGMRLGEILTGASNAMGGFQDAIDAIKMGEFSLAFQITFESIRLQVFDTINSIVNHAKAAASGIAEFLKSLFSLDGALMFTVTSALDYVFAYAKKGLAKAVTATFGQLNFLGKGIRDSMEMAMAEAEFDIHRAGRRIESGMGQIPRQFVSSINSGTEAYKKSLKTAENIIDTSKEELALQELRTELGARMFEDAMKRDAVTKEIVESTKEESAETQQIALARLKIKQLEEDITIARVVGNKEHAKELENEKKHFERLIEYLNQGLSLQDAITRATADTAFEVKKVEVNGKEVTKNLKEQLTLSQKIREEIEKARQAEGIDRGGKLEQRAKEALAEGRFDKADRIAEQLALKEMMREIQDLFGNEGKIGKNIGDIAKELGIDGFGKDRKELMEEVHKELRKREEDAKKDDAKKKEDVDKKKKDDDKKQGKADPMKLINDAVQEIKNLVAKIEPKLPPAALGV